MNICYFGKSILMLLAADSPLKRYSCVNLVHISRKIQEICPELWEKLDSNRVYTVLYWDNAAKAYYVKRFSFPESNNSPVLFISDAKGSRLVEISADKHPQILLTFGGKYEHREAETLDAEEFIAKKGITAKGKKCSPYDLKKVAFGEPLVKEEDEEEVAEAISDEPMDVDLEAEDFEEEAPVTEIEQTGQSSELLKGGEDDTPVDMGDWEPTLF